jgi:hypothetical protein
MITFITVFLSNPFITVFLSNPELAWLCALLFILGYLKELPCMMTFQDMPFLPTVVFVSSSLPYINLPKAFVTSNSFHMVITVNSLVNRRAR